MKLNLFGKLFVLILGLTLSAAGITGFMLLYDMEKSQTHNATREVQRQAENLKGQVEDMIQQKINLGNMIAGHPTVVRKDGPGTDDLIASVQKMDSGYESIFVVGGDGKLTNIMPFAPALVGVQFGDRQYYKDVLQTGKPAISDVLISRNTKKPIFVIASPIKDANGNFMGVVGQTITLDALEHMRANIKAGDTGYALVATNPGNGKSIAIAHPNKELVTDQKDIADIGVIKASLGGQKQLMNFPSLTGVQVIGATDFVSQTRWIITVLVPESEALREVRENRMKVLGLLVVVLIVVSLLTWWFARRLVTPIKLMVQRVEQIADGDLRTGGETITSDDEVGRLYKTIVSMTDNLRQMVGRTNTSAERVAVSSQELTTSAEQLAGGANHVADTICEMARGAESQTVAMARTVQVVELVSAKVEQVAIGATDAANTAGRAAVAAQGGSQAIKTAIIQMGNIESKTNLSSNAISKLGERSQEIGVIVDTIAGIAAQTNLLALNAAIEAARAGEQGRGFAVVAEEVRKLAEQSEEAAKQIAGLIRVIQTDTVKAVETMQDGIREVTVGGEVVNTANQAFAEIASLVEQVSNEITRMAAAVREIGSGSKEMATAVNEVNSISSQAAAHTQSVSAVIEQQSASTQQIAAASENLSIMAQELREITGRFRL